MARYRFAWDSLPPRLLKELADNLAVDGDPAVGLRQRYGGRPKTPFIQQAWPTLLKCWLPADATSRQALADALRSLGLGKTEISIKGKQGQLDYLASCRNATTLRELALEVFLAAGEPAQPPVPPVPEVPASTSRAARQHIESTGPPEPHATHRSTGSPSLDDWVMQMLKAAFGVDEIPHDPDGDIPIPRGSSVLFIRTGKEDSPFLEIFSPLLQNFRQCPEVFEALNSINSRVTLAKAFVTGDGSQIILQALIPTGSLTPEDFLAVVDLVSGAADHFDTLLQKRFGGRTFRADTEESIDV